MTGLTADQAGIRQLHARYADAAWRKDPQGFGDCMTEDCEWPIGGPLSGLPRRPSSRSN